MIRDAERLRHILEAIERIERYASSDGAERELVDNWMVHHLQVIGEAVRALTPEFQSRHTSVPWRQIAAMRHILVHQYFDVDHDIVWRVVREEIPVLKREVTTILREIDAAS